MGNQRKDRTATWPEPARRHVNRLRKTLRLCMAERNHYAGIVAEHEYKWLEIDETLAQVEALGIENHRLREQLRHTLTELAIARNCTSDELKNEQIAVGGELRERHASMANR